MEEDIVYNDVVKIERAGDNEQNSIIELANSIFKPKPHKEPTANDPFADFDFVDD